jgi:hypothetical protein
MNARLPHGPLAPPAHPTLLGPPLGPQVHAAIEDVRADIGNLQKYRNDEAVMAAFRKLLEVGEGGGQRRPRARNADRSARRSSPRPAAWLGAELGRLHRPPHRVTIPLT